jgi:hypothetical protein
VDACSERQLTQSDQTSLLRDSEKALDDISKRKHDLQYKVQKSTDTVRALEVQSRLFNETDFIHKNLERAEQQLSSKLSEVRPAFLELVGSSVEPSSAERACAEELRKAQDAMGRWVVGLEVIYRRNIACIRR